jgi:penicillin-binding protein 1C
VLDRIIEDASRNGSRVCGAFALRARTVARSFRRPLIALAAIALGIAAIPRYPAERLSSRTLASARIMSRDGSLLYEQRSQSGGYGRWVELDAIAPAIVQATLAGEDAHFYVHPGIDPTALARASWLNLRAGRFAYGGSTITQQLAKLLDRQPRTFRGKIVEAIDAVRLERTLSKDQILTQYLNRAYYGRLAYGVEAAAQRYFGKPASELSLDEAALLAILPRAPSAYDPIRHPERALARRRHVLRLMVKQGYIDARTAERAAVVPIRLIDPAQEPAAPHLIDHLIANDIVEPGTDTVRTTLDARLQRRLEARVRMHLMDVADRSVSQAAIVVLDNASGDVLAMVGSRRYGEREVDGSVNGTTAARHPGSALKPFVYALAFERGAQPAMPILDAPFELRDYHPRALDGEHHGLVSMRDALGSSLNVPAVRLASQVGISDLTRFLRDAGMRTIDRDPAHHGLSLALGGAPVRLVDLAAAYSMLARGGTWIAPRYVRGTRRAARRLLSEEAAYLTTDVLADAHARRREFGMETPLELPFVAAVKTGTSQAYCDNVVVGYTPEVTVAVWVGNFDGAPMHGVLSMEGAAPLWRDAMLAAMEGRERRAFVPPAGVRRVRVCAQTGLPASAQCAARFDLVSSRRGFAQPHTDRLAILAPADGATFVLDPLLSIDAQRIPFRASVAVRWELDGRLVADSSEQTFWAPTPGAHRLRAVAEADSAEIRFAVERSRR